MFVKEGREERERQRDHEGSSLSLNNLANPDLSIMECDSKL